MVCTHHDDVDQNKYVLLGYKKTTANMSDNILKAFKILGTICVVGIIVGVIIVLLMPKSDSSDDDASDLIGEGGFVDTGEFNLVNNVNTQTATSTTNNTNVTQTVVGMDNVVSGGSSGTVSSGTVSSDTVSSGMLSSGTVSGGTVSGGSATVSSGTVSGGSGSMVASGSSGTVMSGGFSTQASTSSGSGGVATVSGTSSNSEVNAAEQHATAGLQPPPHVDQDVDITVGETDTSGVTITSSGSVTSQPVATASELGDYLFATKYASSITLQFPSGPKSKCTANTCKSGRTFTLKQKDSGKLPTVTGIYKLLVKFQMKNKHTMIFTVRIPGIKDNPTGKASYDTMQPSDTSTAPWNTYTVDLGFRDMGDTGINLNGMAINIQRTQSQTKTHMEIRNPRVIFARS